MSPPHSTMFIKTYKIQQKHWLTTKMTFRHFYIHHNICGTFHIQQVWPHHIIKKKNGLVQIGQFYVPKVNASSSDAPPNSITCFQRTHTYEAISDCQKIMPRQHRLKITKKNFAYHQTLLKRNKTKTPHTLKSNTHRDEELSFSWP